MYPTSQQIQEVEWVAVLVPAEVPAAVEEEWAAVAEEEWAAAVEGEWAAVAAAEEEWAAVAEEVEWVVAIEISVDNLLMRIAVPIWNDKVSPVFDTASRLLIIETKDLNELARFKTYFYEKDLSRRCFRIQELKVNILICGAISRSFSMILMSAGIKIISGISGKVEDVLSAYLHDTLSNPKFLMPGCNTNSLAQKIKEMN